MKGKVAAIEVGWSHFHLDCSCHRFIHGAAGQEQELIILFQLQLAFASLKLKINNSLTCRKKTAEDQNFQLKKNVQQRQKKIKEAQEEVAEDSGSDPS